MVSQATQIAAVLHSLLLNQALYQSTITAVAKLLLPPEHWWKCSVASSIIVIIIIPEKTSANTQSSCAIWDFIQVWINLMHISLVNYYAKF